MCARGTSRFTVLLVVAVFCSVGLTDTTTNTTAPLITPPQLSLNSAPSTSRSLLTSSRIAFETIFIIPSSPRFITSSSSSSRPFFLQKTEKEGSSLSHALPPLFPFSFSILSSRPVSSQETARERIRLDFLPSCSPSPPSLLLLLLLRFISLLSLSISFRFLLSS